MRYDDQQNYPPRQGRERNPRGTGQWGQGEEGFDERQDVYRDMPTGRSRTDRESRAGGRSEHRPPWRPEEYPRDGQEPRYSGSQQYRGEHDSAGQGDYEEAHYREQRQSHRGKGPKNYARSDERIREEVCDRLTDDHNVDASEIDVEVKEGEVTLTGTVGDRRMKHYAEDCIAEVSGVRDIHNRLKTRGRSDNGIGGMRSQTER